MKYKFCWSWTKQDNRYVILFVTRCSPILLVIRILGLHTEFWWIVIPHELEESHCHIVHPIFRFWFLVTFGNEVMKIRKYYNLQDGQDGKNGKKIEKLKWPKYQNPKDKKWDERNDKTLELCLHINLSKYICFHIF